MTKITLIVPMRISVICKYNLQSQYLSCFFYSKRTTMLTNVKVWCACLTAFRLKLRKKLSDRKVETDYWGGGNSWFL